MAGMVPKSEPTLVINYGERRQSWLAPSRASLDWHCLRAGYQPTPLHDLENLAGELELEHLWVKDETSRLGMPAFKILGASWAAAEVPPADGQAITTATDGNHGRAVARVARQLGRSAVIFVPADIVERRAAAIRDEGAEVRRVQGDYDQAVEEAARFAASTGAFLLSDTAASEVDPVAAAVVDGYGTLFWEIDERLNELGAAPPDLAMLQVGVGGFAAAGIRHLRWAGDRQTIIGSVEPVSAACGLASIDAGRSTRVSGPFTSRMVGLNAGALSGPAWSVLRGGLDLALAIQDDWGIAAQERLHEAGIPSGETGSAGLAGLLAVLHMARQRDQPALRSVRSARTALVVVTEGETNR